MAGPNVDVLAGLPRDPDQLLQRLRADAPAVGSRSTSVKSYSFAADSLRTGRVPADLRRSLYQAVARLPGVVITLDMHDLHDKSGVALGMDDGVHRHHLIIDPLTGAVLGERSVTITDTAWLPRDIVTTNTAARSAVVPLLGARPQ